MSIEPLYAECDNNIHVTGLRRESDNNYENSATITATLKDTSGGVIGTASNITCSYVSSTSGNYLGVIEKAMITGLVSKGTPYKLFISITAESTKDITIERDYVGVAYKGEN